jgi:hypothetical protein
LFFIHEIIINRLSGDIVILGHIQSLNIYSWPSIIYEIKKNDIGEKWEVDKRGKNDCGNLKGRPHLRERGIDRKITL